MISNQLISTINNLNRKDHFMKVGIFDLETSGLSAENSILLCCSIKTYDPYGKAAGKVITLRADTFPSWDKNRLDQTEFIQAVADELDKYDILVAHNGLWFDKKFFTAKCLQYGIKPVLRYKKLIDPVQISRRYLKLSRNSLHSLIDFFKIPEKKTPILFENWLRATINGDKKCMDTICKHCHFDVITLERVYTKIKCLVDKIDNNGSDR